MAEFGKSPPAQAPPATVPAARQGPNKRAGIRRRVLLSGRIVHSPEELTVECAILDISTTGARVRLAGAELLGEPLYLIDMRNGLAFKAHVRWRHENRAGLAFMSYHDLSRPDPDLPRIARRLWLEYMR